MNADDFHARWAKRNAEKQVDINANTSNSNNDLASVNSRLEDISSDEYIERPAPTLDDAQAMTPQSDFTRVMKNDVDAKVKNTALKKLWADPRYNVQDGLDVYIDDYSKPDPMPEGMIAKLAHMSFLTLFDKKEEEDNSAHSDEGVAHPKALPSPQPSPVHTAEGAKKTSAVNTGEGANTEQKIDTPTHENADLQLQPNDAAGRQSDQHGSR